MDDSSSTTFLFRLHRQQLISSEGPPPTGGRTRRTEIRANRCIVGELNTSQAWVKRIRRQTMTLRTNRWTSQRVKTTESNEVVTARRDDGRASSCVMTAP